MDDAAGGTTRPLAQGIARAALSIAVVTVLARVVGFVRVAVLARTVGTTCLGDIYQSANTIPNVVFEIAAGGALAGLVVPVLARPLASGDAASARRTTSALLGWTLLLLTPVALLGLLFREEIMALLLAGESAACGDVDQVAVGARMLAVFLPQIVLYGIGLVLTGALQAQRRFLGPALAPLLSSLVVIGAYLAYAAQSSAPGLASLSRTEELTLSLGTTAGVAVLALSLLVPLRRTVLRRGALRPTLHFPPGVARRVRHLAYAGTAGLIAQQLSIVVALRLANGGPPGSVIVYTVALTVFLVPWAVCAMPMATSAFPTLAAAADAGDERTFADTGSGDPPAGVVPRAGAAAVLIAAAGPAARILVAAAPGRPSVDPLTEAIVAFAPGLLGYGLLALLVRALYARGAGRAAAVSAVAGWLVVIAADISLAGALPVEHRIAALGAGNSIGLLVAGALLLRALRRNAGRPAVAGLGRVIAVAVPAAVVAAAVGAAVAGVLGPSSAAGSVPDALGASLVAAVLFGAALIAGGIDDARQLMTATLRAARRRGTRG